MKFDISFDFACNPVLHVCDDTGTCIDHIHITPETVKYIKHGPEMVEALEEVMASKVITGMGASIRCESRRRHMLPGVPSPSSKKKDMPLTAQSNLIPFIKDLLAKLEG